MAINNYVEQILSRPVYVFDEIIEKLIGRNVHLAKIELTRHSMEVDNVLFESIKSVLQDLKEEEGVISRFLYSTFGFELRKNKRREQLIYLGSELKTQHSKIRTKLYGLNRQKERLDFSIVDLKRLQDGFSETNIFFKNDKAKNKSKFFFKEIENNINQLSEYQLSLLMKYNNLMDIEKVYSVLFKKIPRYNELIEESHLLLLAPRKK